MATSYPAALDSLPNPSPTDALENATPALDHDVQHANANDAIEAIQAELGVNPSGASATVAEWRAAQRRTLVDPAVTVNRGMLPGCIPTSFTTSNLSANRDHFFPIHCEDAVTFSALTAEVTTAAGAGATGRIAIYNSTAACQPGDLVEDFGTFAADTTGVKTLTPSGGTRTLPAGRYLLAIAVSATTVMRAIGAQPLSGLISGNLGGSPFTQLMYSSRAYGAFPSPGVAWTGSITTTVAPQAFALLRVTAVG